MAKKNQNEIPNDDINKCITSPRISIFKNLQEVLMDRNSRVIVSVILMVGGLILMGMGLVSHQVGQVGYCGPMSALVTPVPETTITDSLDGNEVSTASATPSKAKRVGITLPSTN